MKKIKKYQAGGVSKPALRVGPVDPDGAWTKVQERTIAGSKEGAPSLVKDKELGATKMKKGGKISTAKKKFAALAPPKNKVTFADKIAGAKKAKKK